MPPMLDTTTTELDATVAGPVLEPGDPGYAEEVASFSLTFAAAPAVVVGATSAADVAAAVRFAARTGRRGAVQSTGHGLQSDLAGTVLDAPVAGRAREPVDPGYAEEVASFSLTFAAAPAVVVGAPSAADVAAAVRFAARTGRRVAVQSTGHGLQSDLAGTVLVSTRR